MPFFLGMVWLYRGRSYHRLINNTALQPTAALMQVQRIAAKQGALFRGGVACQRECRGRNGGAPGANFPGSRPIEDVSGFQARPAGKPQARMAAKLDVVKARALSPASRALVMSAAGSRV